MRCARHRAPRERQRARLVAVGMRLSTVGANGGRRSGLSSDALTECVRRRPRIAGRRPPRQRLLPDKSRGKGDRLELAELRRSRTSQFAPLLPVML